MVSCADGDGGGIWWVVLKERGWFFYSGSICVCMYVSVQKRDDMAGLRRLLLERPASKAGLRRRELGFLVGSHHSQKW